VRTRWQASGIHLLLGTGVALAVLALLLAVWYPGPLFEAAGGKDLLFLLVGVDIVLGPLITLIIFRRGKPGLRFDLTVVALLQVAALLYGSHVLFLARPAFIVFVKDRFEVASAVEIDPAELAKAKHPQFRHAPLGGPMLAAADFPSDPAARQRLVDAALSGLDAQHFASLWAPYAERKSEVLAKAQTVAEARRTEPAHAKVIDDFLARSGIKEADVRWLALRARRAWVAVLIDAKTAEPVKMLLAEKI
jgi:hypothetical protein